jgi:hypothetical protein
MVQLQPPILLIKISSLFKHFYVNAEWWLQNGK